MKKIFTQIAEAFGCLFLAGCDTVFDVHPYDVHVDGDKNVNAANIAKIESAIKYKDTIRFAMISDTHQWLDDLKKEVNDINRRKDSIDFVLHCGDVTDFGATQEFQWTRDRLQKLKMPFVDCSAIMTVWEPETKLTRWFSASRISVLSPAG